MAFLRAAVAAAVLLGVISCGAPHRSGDKPAPSVPSPKGPTAAVNPQPFNASGLLAGSAAPNLPDGEPGKVSVLQIGPLGKDGGSGSLPFAFRNNTSQAVSHIDWAATARNGGAIVATGSSQGTIPAQVQPGEVGIAFIFFDGNSQLPPENAKYEFSVKTSSADQAAYNTAALKVTEANTSGDAIVGAAVNDTGKTVAGPFSVSVYCFDGNNLLSHHGAFTQQDGPTATGGQVTFTDALYGATCPTFAVGVAGYFEG